MIKKKKKKKKELRRASESSWTALHAQILKLHVYSKDKIKREKI